MNAHEMQMWNDRCKDEKSDKKTKVFVDMGIPADAVEVIVHEIEKSHWGVGGEPASEKLKDVHPS